MGTILDILLIIQSFLTFSPASQNVKYWDEFSAQEKNVVLKYGRVDALILGYYNGKIVPSDDERTFALLNTLSEDKGCSEDLPLRFYLFNRILTEADGAIAEILGSYCLLWLDAQCFYVFYYLRNHPEIEDYYLHYLSAEFYFSGDDPNIRFNTFRQTILGKCNIEGPYLMLFFEKLKTRIESLQQNP